VRVFPVRYADARQLAAAIQQVFGTQSSSRGNANAGPQLQIGQFPGLPGFEAGAGGPGFSFGGGEVNGTQAGGGRGRGSAGAAGMSAAPSVVAVADETSNCVAVRAPADTMRVIADVVTQIDVPVTDVTEVRVFRLANANPTELVEQLGQLFPNVTRSNTDETTTAFPPGGPPFLRGLGNGGPPGTFSGGFGSALAGSGESSRVRKLGDVIAVADERTSTLIVRAASARMPQIEAMVLGLDANSAGREVVKVWGLKNANPEVVNQVLQDLFNRNSQQRQTTANSQEQDPLMARQAESRNANGAGFGGQNGGARGGASFPE
jgi:hypothetical protein